MKQRGILHVDLEDLAKLLGLPEFHVVERVTLVEDRYWPPGLLVTVRGTGMPYHQTGAPLMIERYADVAGKILEERAKVGAEKIVSERIFPLPPLKRLEP